MHDAAALTVQIICRIMHPFPTRLRSIDCWFGSASIGPQKLFSGCRRSSVPFLNQSIPATSETASEFTQRTKIAGEGSTVWAVASIAIAPSPRREEERKSVRGRFYCNATVTKMLSCSKWRWRLLKLVRSDSGRSRCIKLTRSSESIESERLHHFEPLPVSPAASVCSKTKHS